MQSRATQSIRHGRSSFPRRAAAPDGKTTIPGRSMYRGGGHRVPPTRSRVHLGGATPFQQAPMLS